MTPVQIALGINGALYTLCCFAAGLATGNGLAWGFAIAAFASQTLAHMLPDGLLDGEHTDIARRCLGLWAFECGVAAGIALLARNGA